MSDDVRNILINNGFEEFIPVFEENNLDKEILSELTEADYRKLGVPDDAVDKMMLLFSVSSNSSSPQTLAGSVNDYVTVASINQEIPAKSVTSPVSDSPIHNMLIQNGLVEYVPLFDQHKLTSFDVISKLTEGDLSELGIHAIGDRKKIKELFHINENKAEDNNVVVTQTVKSEGTNTAGIVVSILVGAVLICIVLYYAIPRFIL
jgi:hypothetical protein